MSLVIMIPTLERPQALLWSLRSVLNQKLGDIGTDKKIFILNNDPDSKEAVNISVTEAIHQAGDHDFDEIKVVQGNTKIPAVKNIYGHFREFTKDGDIAIIHGDDDLMFPNTLLNRYKGCIESKEPVCVAKNAWSCFFFRNVNGVYLDRVADPYKIGGKQAYRKAVKQDLTGFPLPFISIYTLRMGPVFWSLYDEAIEWADRLPFEPKVKYPFTPFFIGLAAYSNKQMSVCDEELVIRGQVYASRFLLPPATVTEYANGGIIQLTGLAVLHNEELGGNSDYDQLRNKFKEGFSSYILQTLCRRDGVSLGGLKKLYKMAGMKIDKSFLTAKTVLSNLRKLSDNIVFTSNIKRWITGWGVLTSPEEFWTNWKKKNSEAKG